VRDSDEFEKEGYLHGKKILHDESESGSESEAEDVNAETVGCPKV